jgi:hypothetical protein
MALAHCQDKVNRYDSSLDALHQKFQKFMEKAKSTSSNSVQTPERAGTASVAAAAGDTNNKLKQSLVVAQRSVAV